MRIINALLLSAILILFIGCSKDKMLEKRIHKKDGKWNISTLHYTLIYQTTGGQQTKIATAYNVGSFTFDKDKGTYTYEVEGFTRTGSFSWSVDDQKINLTHTKQSIDFSSGSVNQTVLTLTGTEADKKLTLEGTEIEQEVGSSVEQFALTGTFILTR